MGVKDFDVDEAVPTTQLPPYINPRKPTTKVNKDPYSMNFQVSTPFLLKYVTFEGNLLDWILFLEIQHWTWVMTRTSRS